MLPTGVSSVGGSQPHDNMMPYLTLNFIIALQGIFPAATSWRAEKRRSGARSGATASLFIARGRPSR